LCRTCERSTGVDTRTTFERERDRLARRAERLGAERRARPRIERTWPTYCDRGVEYEVTWDGQFGASLEERRRW
jgi:hypothetical protein